MKAHEALRRIAEERPRVVYLSGKTCTGKTTLAQKLGQEGYSIIELDPIVKESVAIPFGLPDGDAFIAAYRDQGPAGSADAFAHAARAAIEASLKASPVVVEGAIASSRVLKAVMSGPLSDFSFIYLHPVDQAAYAERIRARLVAAGGTGSAGLPNGFWRIAPSQAVKEFKETGIMPPELEKAIGRYVQASIEESEKRLADFQGAFPKILVVEA
jgi:hypothetical protein